MRRGVPVGAPNGRRSVPPVDSSRSCALHAAVVPASRVVAVVCTAGCSCFVRSARRATHRTGSLCGATAAGSSARPSPCRSTGRTRSGARIDLAPRPAAGRRAAGSASCSRIRAGPAARASSSCSRPATCSTGRSRPVRHRVVGSRGRRRRARRSTAADHSTTSTRSTAAAPTPATARANAAVAKRLAAACAARERPEPAVPLDRRRPSATWMPSAPRWACRRSTTSASRTAPTSARSTPTVTRTACARWCSTARSTRRPRTTTRRCARRSASSTRSTRSSPGAATIATARSPATGTRRAAFDDLMTVARRRDRPGRPCTASTATLGIGEANIGVADRALRRRGRDGWDALGPRSNDAARGDGVRAARALRRVHGPRTPAARTTTRPPAFYAIGCLDGPRAADSRRRSGSPLRAARVAPHFGASTVWLGLAVHVLAGAAGRRGRAAIHAAGAPPIVVVGNTDDPATPYSQAQALADELAAGAPAHVRRRGPHRVRPRRRLHRQRRRPLPVSLTVPRGRQRGVASTRRLHESSDSMRIALPRRIL